MAWRVPSKLLKSGDVVTAAIWNASVPISSCKPLTKTEYKMLCSHLIHRLLEIESPFSPEKNSWFTRAYVYAQWPDFDEMRLIAGIGLTEKQKRKWYNYA